MMYDLESKQTQLWDAIGVPTLDNAFKGFNGTIFAYGQTGSGKTFSMQGVRNDPVLTGVIPRMCSGLFERIDALKAGPTGADKLFLVTCSYVLPPPTRRQPTNSLLPPPLDTLNSITKSFAISSIPPIWVGRVWGRRKVPAQASLLRSTRCWAFTSTS